jgi:hypothetical protein
MWRSMSIQARRHAMGLCSDFVKKGPGVFLHKGFTCLQIGVVVHRD